ncbi:MAG: hypothetical protein AAFW89_09045, partial [Bacteroidota bacterium]
TLIFQLVDNNGLTNKNPYQMTIAAMDDQYPFVEIIDPDSDISMVKPDSLTIEFRVDDDFGIRRTELGYRMQKAFVDEPTTGKQILRTTKNGTKTAYLWDLKELGLSTQDQLTFWIDVWDNDSFSGSKRTRSAELTLTVPSLIDYFEELDTEEEQVEQTLEEVVEGFDEIEQQYQEFKEGLKEEPLGGYEQQRQLEQIKQQQENVEERIEELNQKFDEIKKELDEQNLLSEETMEAYDQLKQLMEDIDDPAFREALEKLQQQMGRMSPDQMRQALDEVEFNEQLYKERIERTLELFKQLKLTSDLDQIAASFEDLAEQDSVNSSSPGQEEARNNDLQNQLEQLQEQVDQLSENTSEKNEADINEYQELTTEDLQKLIEELQDQIAQQQSQENQESDGGSSEPSDMKQEFNKLAERTRSLMNGMSQEQQNINISGLMYILDAMLRLSVEQEKLSEVAQRTESRSQAYIDYAREQKNVKDIFSSLSDSLFALSTEIPQFSNQINTKKLDTERQLDASLAQMAQRDQPKAAVATRQVLGGVNELTFMIANLLEQLQNPSGNGGGSGMSMQQMIQQMQQMGENQQQLNEQIQNMINDMQGDRLSNDQMERLNQMARQQNSIRKQLEQLQQQGGLEGDALGSELERMIEQMEETINDLRGGATDPLLIERQQNILQRMLDSKDALEERDEEEKREGTTGKELNRVTPPEMTLEELEKEIRKRLNDPTFTKYNPDYQKLIERYFELLKEAEERDS